MAKGKISLQMLSDMMANNSGRSKAAAETFVRLFFSTLKDALQRDNIIKIKGFGTFKLVVVAARESVNVNNGERVSIAEYNKITFTPDKSLKDRINRPFAQFETISLDEDDLVELTNDEAPVEDEVATPVAAGNIAESVAKPSVSSAETESSSSVEEETSIPQQPSQPTQDSPEVVPAGNSEASQQPTSTMDSEETDADTENKEDTKPAPSENISPATLQEAQEPTASAQPVANSEQPAEVDSKPAEPLVADNDSKDDQTINASTINADTINANKINATKIQSESTAPDSNPAPATSSSKTHKWLIFVIVILVLVIIGLSYALGYYQSLKNAYKTSLEESTNKIEAPQADPADTLTSPAPATEVPGKPVTPQLSAQELEEKRLQEEEAEKKRIREEQIKAYLEQKEAERQKFLEKREQQLQQIKEKKEQEQARLLQNTSKYPQLEDGAYLMSDPKDFRRIKPGSNLITFCKQIYGRADVYKYVVKYNNLSDPDNIPVGRVIKFPTLIPKQNSK